MRDLLFELGDAGLMFFTDRDKAIHEMLRVLTPVMKLTTGKQAVLVASEVLETFGGAGYVEDTGLPVLLRDSQVLPIWEGTTNVLALDTLRVKHGLKQIEAAVARSLEDVSDPPLANAARVATSALDHARSWLAAAERAGQPALEAGARRFALTLGRTMELGLLIKHAQWSNEHESARRFANSAIDLIGNYEVDPRYPC